MTSAFGIAVLAVVLAIAASGCTLPPSQVRGFDGSLVLTYTLRHAGNGPIGVEPGHHCGTAEVAGDRLKVDRGAYDGLGRPNRLLIVDPTLEGRDWVTSGSNPFPAAFPEVLRPFDGDHRALAAIDWSGDTVTVDGQAVTLPHEWTAEDPGRWSASLRLEAGPDRLTVYGSYPCA